MELLYFQPIDYNEKSSFQGIVVFRVHVRSTQLPFYFSKVDSTGICLGEGGRWIHGTLCFDCLSMKVIWSFSMQAI